MMALLRSILPTLALGWLLLPIGARRGPLELFRATE